MDDKYGVYVTRVIDGDTFVGDVPFHVLGHVLVLRDQHFRLQDINAPEVKGATKELGLESKKFLEELIGGKQVTVQVSKRDSFGRWIAIAFLGNLEVNTHMILKGFAERYEKY